MRDRKETGESRDRRCKLAVLPGMRLHKLALHYSRAAEPLHPETRFSGRSVARHWVQAPCAAKAGCKICMRWALIGSRGHWRGSCHSHKHRTSSSGASLPLTRIPVPVPSLFFFFILSLVWPVGVLEIPLVSSLVPSVVFRWTFL